MEAALETVRATLDLRAARGQLLVQARRLRLHPLPPAPRLEQVQARQCRLPLRVPALRLKAVQASLWLHRRVLVLRLERHQVPVGRY